MGIGKSVFPKEEGYIYEEKRKGILSKQNNSCTFGGKKSKMLKSLKGTENTKSLHPMP